MVAACPPSFVNELIRSRLKDVKKLQYPKNEHRHDKVSQRARGCVTQVAVATKIGALKTLDSVVMIASHFQERTSFVSRAGSPFRVQSCVVATKACPHAVIHSLRTRQSRLVLAALCRGE